MGDRRHLGSAPSNRPMIDQPPIGVILWAGNRPGDHFDHIHVEPPDQRSGKPPRSNPGPTPGLLRIQLALTAIFGDWPDDYGYYNRRKIAGSNTWSQHAYANAQDIGPLLGVKKQRPIYDYLTKGMVPEMVLDESSSGRVVRAMKKEYNDWVKAVGWKAGAREVDATNDSYGSAMTDLIKVFQAWCNLPITGTVDGLTMVMLHRWPLSGDH